MAQRFHDADNRIDEDQRVFQHTGCLIWLLILCAAIVVHQLTGNAIFAAALPYVQAGWKSLRCGLWLLNADPVASRGRACFWFCLAMAFWNAAASAFTSVMIFLAIDHFTGRAPAMDELAVTMLTLTGGLCLSTVIGIAGITCALRGKVRVWVHPNVREICRGDFSRLGNSERRYPGRNHAPFVVITSLVFPFLAAGITLLIWLAPGDHPNDVRTITVLVEIFFLFVGPLAMIPLYPLLSSRLVAHTPAECWRPSTAAFPDRESSSESFMRSSDQSPPP